MVWTIPLLVIAVLLIALLVLPMGAELTYREGQRRWLVILFGIRMPIPYKLLHVLHRLTRIFVRKSKRAVASGRFQSRLMQYLKQAATGPGTDPEKLEVEDVKEGWRLFRRFLRHVHVRVHYFDAIIATADPAMTGMAYGWAMAAQAWLPASWHVNVGVDFVGTESEVDFQVEVRFTPVKLIGVGLAYLAKRLWRNKTGRRPHYS